jgi:hypothetical protein
MCDGIADIEDQVFRCAQVTRNKRWGDCRNGAAILGALTRMI